MCADEKKFVYVVIVSFLQAVHASAACNHGDEAWHLLQAGLHHRSHEIVVNHLAADCIINGTYVHPTELPFWTCNIWLQ